MHTRTAGPIVHQEECDKKQVSKLIQTCTGPGPTQEAKHVAAICRAAVLKATSSYNCVDRKKCGVFAHQLPWWQYLIAPSIVGAGISGHFWTNPWMDALRLSAPKDRGLHLLITFGWVCYGHIMS